METQKFKHTELTFQLMVDAAPNALILVNKESKIAYANLHAEKLFKYSKSELIGQGVEILIPDRLRMKHPGFVQYFFTSPQARAMGMGRELFAVKKDGTEFPVEIGLNPLVTIDGTMVLAAIIDITERKRAEDRFRLVVESAPNAMVLVNREGNITLINQQTESLFGYGRQELIGQKVEILIPERFRKQHPGFRKFFFTELQTRAMGAGRELYAIRKDGTEIPVEIGLNPIEAAEGDMVLASIIDISERKLQEEAIKKQIELESKNKELEQFAYIASHDLREPLRTISNYIQVLEEDFIIDKNSKEAAYVSSMHRALKRMDKIIGALLEYSRLGRRGALMDVDVKRIINEVRNDLESLIVENDITLHVSDMPVIKAYETEMHQLFQNLISNAIKFRRKNIKTEIYIKAEKRDKKWRFSVRDNGIGIKAKYFDRIFQIFQRLHSHEEYEGHGIGLAYCKKIVELHNGEIWVESTPDHGSTFYFTIPIQNL